MFLPYQTRANQSVAPALPQDPRVLVITCGDSRLSQVPWLTQPPGIVFVHRNIAGVVQPRHETDRSFDAFMEFPLTKLEGISTIVVMGHTDCGGINELTRNILENIPRAESSLADWIVPLADEKIIHAVRAAHDQGVPRAQIASTLGQIMPLLSTRRLLEREVTHEGATIVLGDLILEKKINLVPALYDIGKEETYVFDFKQKLYVASALDLLPMVNASKGEIAFSHGSHVSYGAVITPDKLSRTLDTMLKAWENRCKNRSISGI